MARPLRIIFKGAWYHVMHRGANRQNIFFDDNDRCLFLSILGNLTVIHGVEIHAYCLMTNHYHIVMHTPRGNLSSAMQYLNSKYTQSINAKWKRDGALFRGRYKAILIGEDDYLLRVSRYIHLNPREAKMISVLSKYQWSSYAYYLGKKNPPSWLVVREIERRFGVDQFKKRYKHYVEQEGDKQSEDFYFSNRVGPVFGDEDYCEKIFQDIKAHSLSAEIIGAEYIITPPSIDTILSEVALFYRVKIQSIVTVTKQSNKARRAAIYLCREVGGYAQTKIATVMGGVGYAAISKLIARSKKDIAFVEEMKIIAEKLIKNAKRISDY